ncbi:MAG: SDR family oxidoreductase [Verrucomicrobiae bacterium]|nr:SDR family oxidoreductase [Verrucomicrobiae bacterium]
MSGRLRDRVVVIVGGTSGLGKSAAFACVREGARVVAVGRDPGKAEALAAELGESVRSLAADAVQPETAARAVDLARSTWGRLDALYHVAGGSGRRHGDGPLHEISDAGWAHTLDLNLTSLFHSNRAAVRAFLEQGGGGSVVNCGSVLGFSPSPRHFATHAYAASKAAIIGLTRSAAAHYAPQNIRFNVLAPALVATPMSARAQSDDAILEFIRAKQPLEGGRIGHPEDLDGAVVWLLSGESRYVTGQVIAVDGGWSVSDASQGMGQE